MIRWFDSARFEEAGLTLSDVGPPGPLSFHYMLRLEAKHQFRAKLSSADWNASFLFIFDEEN